MLRALFRILACVLTALFCCALRWYRILVADVAQGALYIEDFKRLCAQTAQKHTHATHTHTHARMITHRRIIH
jgi:hypothetical protein